MRRNSLLILTSMIVLLIVIAVLLFYILSRLPVSETGVTSTVIPATATDLPEQQILSPSGPVDMPMRFVYIVSLMVVFVSAVLVLFGMLLKALIKDTK
jgi:hypothetical protein